MIYDQKPMSGRICLVTGATSGIGAATLLSLSRQGATVVGVGRDLRKCSESRARIERATGSTVEFLWADLSAKEDILRLAGEFRARHQRLDVLVNNAGARFSDRLVSADGLEMTFALNHLAYFLLTSLLLPELKNSFGGRIVNVASQAHHGCAGIDFSDLQGSRSYSGKVAYAQSKLANLLFTYELDRRLKGTAITVNAADPGNVLTGFCRNNGLVSWGRHLLGSLRSGGLVGPQTGAQTSIYLACSPEVDGVSGKYFSKKEAVQSSTASYDLEAARRLWQVSLELTDPQPGRHAVEMS